MQKLVEGIQHFQKNEFVTQRELFARLAKGQQPEVLFITCADSRIDPNLLTHTEPGDLFILRNAGNIVPPYGAVVGGEAATIEYSVAVLGVKEIIICGHSQCGAMKGLLHPEELSAIPSVGAWLSHAEATRRIVAENYSDLPEDRRLMTAVEENVLVQLENLHTHPSVAAAVARGNIKLMGWVYEIESGEVRTYDPGQAKFVQLTADHSETATPPPSYAAATRSA